MDPNESLEELRAAIAVFRPHAYAPVGDSSTVLARLILIAEAGADVVTAWDALDQWMSKGGFRPDDWKPSEIVAALLALDGDESTQRT